MNRHLRKVMFVFMLVCGSWVPTFAQNMINGTVKDASGAGLPGVSVLVQGQNRGTVSNLDGEFAVAAEDGDVLVISFIGFSTQKITVSGNVMDIAMKEDALSLDEVVITGLSVATSKKQLGNAISTVQAKDLVMGGAQGVDQAMAGKVAGALVNQNSGNPAGGISVTLRGTSTIVGDGNPLYIVDGVFIDNSSPELLDLGGYAQNRLVDINPDDIDHIEVIKGAAAAAIYGSRASNGVVQIFTKKGTTGKPQVSFSTSFNVNKLRKQIEENMESIRYINPGDPSQGTEPTERYNQQDHIFGTGYGTNSTISVRGGTESTKYYFSGSAFFNQGIVNNTDFGRYTMRSNIDQVFNKWLTGSIGMSYTRSSSNEIPNGGLGEFYGALTGFNFNNNTYDPKPDADGNYSSPRGFVVNPVEAIDTYEFKQKTDRFTGNLGLNMNPIEGLNINFRFGLDTYNQAGTGYIPVGTNGLYSTGWAQSASVNKVLTNQDLTLTYTFDVTSAIKSTTTAGGSLQYDKTESLSITANNLSPLVKTTDGGSVTGRRDYRAERSYRGAFIQETFSFADKVFVTGALRVDTASPFGVDVRTQTYGKFSASYVISDESFWQNSIGSVINTFKLRTSWGQAGNLNALGAYDRFSNYSPNPMVGQTGLVPTSALGNPDLGPERQTEIEIGADIGLMDGRIGLEFTYYNMEVTDLLLNRILAPTTGFNTQIQNVGTMTNKGIELLLRANVVNTGDFKWNIIATYSSNDNVINGIEDDKLPLAKSFNIAVAQNGESIGSFDGFYYAREADGSISLDDNGLPSRALDENGSNDRKIIGDPNPDWQGSLINQFSYKNFSLSVQFDAVQGFDVFNFTDRVNSRSAFGGGRRDAQELRGELAPGYNNAAYNIWERYIEDGSFIKLREMRIAYNLRPKNGAVSRINFYVVGRNLVSFDNYSGWDPEVSAAGQQNGVRGFDFNEVPIPKTWQLGVKVDF